MQKYLLVALAAFGFTALSHAADPKVGDAAPEFTLTDSQGQAHSIASFQGKYVVLEWLNHGCPFVRKHYDSNNMQKLQETYTGKGVVWLSIVSSAKGKEGFVDGAAAQAERAENKSKATAILLDGDGKVGKLYGAKTTPHLFVINPVGKLIYMGAIDDRPSVDPKDVAGAKNYVARALDQAMSGKTVTNASTKAYGCSVKYAN